MTTEISDEDLEDLLDESESTVVEDPLRGKCSGCGAPSSFMRKDVLGHVHRACTPCSKYLEGWVRDVEHEVNSESAAAARYERAAYGDRE